MTTCVGTMAPASRLGPALDDDGQPPGQPSSQEAQHPGGSPLREPAGRGGTWTEEREAQARDEHPREPEGRGDNRTEERGTSDWLTKEAVAFGRPGSSGKAG